MANMAEETPEHTLALECSPPRLLVLSVLQRQPSSSSDPFSNHFEPFPLVGGLKLIQYN